MEETKEQFVVYIGEKIDSCHLTIERAKEAYDKLPSGEGKRHGLRRSLVKEQILIEDKLKR